MQIQNGKLYENRTWLYLYPSLRFYGDDLVERLGKFFKLAVGVGDVNYSKKGNCIFILFHMELPFADRALEKYRKDFSEFLSWLSYKPYYVTDYVYNEKEQQHMVVIKLPKAMDSAYLDFVAGRYSNMYTDKQVDHFFEITKGLDPGTNIRNERYLKVRKIFKKDKLELAKFVNKVNEEFKTNVSIEKFEKADIDFPPKKEEEIFNYGTRTEI